MTTALFHYRLVDGAELYLESGTYQSLMLEDGSGALLLDYFYGVEWMSTTLFDLTYRVAREVGYVNEGVATDGSTTTVIDTNDRTEDDDYWNGGTVWVIRDSAGAGAAPELEYGIISDFDNSSSTVTVRSAVTAAIASSDRYAIADDTLPLNTIISKINQAVLQLGGYPVTDKTTVEIGSDQTEYTLPIAANYQLLMVEMQNEDDANDNRWTEITGWKIERTGIGSADTLILPYQYSDGYDVKLTYKAPHAELYQFDDNLSESVPMELIIYPAIRDCFLWLKQQYRRPDWDADIEHWRAKADVVVATRPVFMPRKPSKVLTLKSTDALADDDALLAG